MKKHIKKTILATAAGAATFTATGAAASADDVTIKAGDTLSQLAIDHNTTADALASLNGISNKDLIFAGDVLKIDGAKSVKQAASTQASAQPATKEETPVDSKAAAQSAAVPAQQSADDSSATAPAQQSSVSLGSQSLADTSSYSAGADAAIQTMIDAMNAKRAALGLAPVRYDASLSATAQGRAAEGEANGGLPSGHFQQVAGPEVVAIGFDPSSVVDAWYNETNMITNGTPSHRLWLTNASISRVGFGISGSTIVGIAG